MTNLFFRVIVAVWGEEFTRRFVDTALPSFMSPGNLPTLVRMGQTQLVCLTRPEDEQWLRSRPPMWRAAELMQWRFLPVEPERFATPYAAMADAHHRAAIVARADDACAVFLGPDIVLADGALAVAAKAIASGKKVVLTCGLRLNQETAEPALKSLGLGSEPSAAVLHPRTLMRFALDHAHPEQKRLCYDDPDFTNDPVTVLWPHDDDGLLVRSFHLHPLLVDMRECRGLDALSRDTIDGAFIAAAFPDWRQIHVETDSDNILVFSLSSGADRAVSRLRRQAKPARLRAVAYQWNVNPLHRWLFTHAIRLHAADLDESWERLEAASRREVSAALDIVALPWPQFLRWKATVAFERASITISRWRLRLWVHRWRLALGRQFRGDAQIDS